MNAHRLRQRLRDREYREAYGDALLSSSIALQIKALREQRGWTQAELARRAGKKQSWISTMENPDYSRWSIKSLRELASAFDLALVVRFENWGKLLGSLGKVTRKNLERPSFDDDSSLTESEEKSWGRAISTSYEFQSESSYHGYTSAYLGDGRTADTIGSGELVGGING